jgi:hypothetical protein
MGFDGNGRDAKPFGDFLVGQALTRQILDQTARGIKKRW